MSRLLMDEIKFYIKDEEDANATYTRMAGDADNAGMHDTARILKGMAADELRHKEMLEGMYYNPEKGYFTPPELEAVKQREKEGFYEMLPGETVEEHVQRMEYELGHIHPSQYKGGSRLFPQTYGDWINLAEDIKKHYPPGSMDVDETNFELGVIGGLEEENPEDAKRWLMEKARKLGIS